MYTARKKPWGKATRLAATGPGARYFLSVYYYFCILFPLLHPKLLYLSSLWRGKAERVKRQCSKCVDATSLIIGVISLLLKSSCPFVYAYDGHGPAVLRAQNSLWLDYLLMLRSNLA